MFLILKKFLIAVSGAIFGLYAASKFNPFKERMDHSRGTIHEIIEVEDD